MNAKKIIYRFLIVFSFVLSSFSYAMSELSDDEMADTQGQALFNLSYLAPGEPNNTAPANANIGFYTFSMEAEVALNANIRSLKLGCGGVNGAGSCDVDIEKFSLGCIANASGVCITLPPTSIQKTGTNNDNSDTGQALMRDFVLKNPFYQFAIKNPTTAATRELVGVRIGAANVKGPMSFDSINTFSGYLTGLANVEMRGQGPRPENLAADQEDVAVTCKTPNVCPDAAGRSDYTGMADYRYMGLDDAQVCVIWPACANFKQLTISFTGISRNNRVATVNGVRQTQAYIANLNLGNATNGGEDGVTKAITNSMEIERTTNFFGSGLLNAVLGLIKNNAANKIVDQLAAGLGTTATQLNNNTYQLPYNLRNVHQLEVDSTTFGLALSKQALRYPGFAADVNRGWSMYIPDAFTLNISDRTTTFVQGIAQSSAARDGNIVYLEAPYRNCWGTLRFC